MKEFKHPSLVHMHPDVSLYCASIASHKSPPPKRIYNEKFFTSLHNTHIKQFKAATLTNVSSTTTRLGKEAVMAEEMTAKVATVLYSVEDGKSSNIDVDYRFM